MSGFRVRYSRRRRSIGLKVEADGSVEVRAPIGVPRRVLASIVEQRREWIERQRARLLQAGKARAGRRVAHGASIAVLGVPRRIVCAASRSGLAGRLWMLRLPKEAPYAELRGEAERVLREEARAHFEARCGALGARMGLHPASVGIKGYRTRWGSCHADGRVYFNWRLMFAPDWVADSVVVHELAHLAVHDHSRAFHALVARFDPRKKESRAWLREHGPGLDFAEG